LSGIAQIRNDAPISEAFLLDDRMFVIVPTSRLEPGANILSTSSAFVHSL
jgi:hypothetical protein